MTVQNTFVSVTNGDQLNEGYFNGIYQYADVWKQTNISVYTGDGFDTSATSGSDATVTDTDDHTLQIASDKIENFVLIQVTGNYVRTNYGINCPVSVSLKIETAETGGSFTTRFDKIIVSYNDLVTGGVTDTITISFYYAPTSGEKTNGLDVKLSSTSSKTGTSAVASFTNIQTVIFVN